MVFPGKINYTKITYKKIMTKPTTDKLQLELKENQEKVQQLTNMINSLQIRNIQIEAIIADRLDDFSKEEKEQVKQDAVSLYGIIS